MPPQPAAILEALHSVFGYDQFRPHQEEAVTAALAGRDVLVVMPTGAGKSLTFQLPAAINSGVTLVISPLIALMRDQVIALQERTSFGQMGAAYLNSSMSQQEQWETMTQLRVGTIKLLYVAPERLRSNSFVELLTQVQLARVVVDEAHCISEWGHDFRPDYLAIKDILPILGHPPVMAVTATATRRVQQSIASTLGMRDPFVLVGGFNRPNLHFSVVRCRNEAERAHKLEKALPRLVARSGSGLIYCSTRKQCEEVAAICARAMAPTGQRAGIYHAGLNPDARHAVQEAWLRGEVTVLVATNAFGMGIDKPDVRFVIHWGYPESPEAYYQEAGRAGRDGRKGRCVILAAGVADKKLREFFIDNEALTVNEMAAAVTRLGQMSEDVLRIPRGWWEQEFDWKEPKPRVMLGKLERAGVLERLGEQQDYTSLRMLRKKLDTGTLDRLKHELDKERNNRYERLGEMQAYIKGHICRRRSLLGYFGDHDFEKSEFCCDICDGGGRTTAAAAPALPTGGTPEPPRSIVTLHDLLHGLDSLSPNLGRGRLTRVLRGSATEDVARFAKHVLYGSLRGRSVKEISALLDEFIAHGLLHQGEEEDFFVLRVTAQGRKAWEEDTPLQLSWPLPAGRSAARATHQGRSSLREAEEEEWEGDSELFETLRRWRRQRAQEENIAPYLIFPDRVLRQIASVCPRDEDELLSIAGIGASKLERYGESVLAMVNRQSDAA